MVNSANLNVLQLTQLTSKILFNYSRFKNFFFGRVEELNKTLLEIGANFNDSSKQLLQEIKALRETISTFMMKVSELSNLNSKSENLLSIPDKNNTLLTSFKFSKSNPLFFFSKSVVS